MINDEESQKKRPFTGRFLFMAGEEGCDYIVILWSVGGQKGLKKAINDHKKI